MEEKKKEKRHWRDYLDGNVELDDELKSAKRAKVDLEGKEAKDLKLEDITSKQVEKIGSVDPIGDFKKLLARRDGDFVAKAIGEMWEMIKGLVRTSFGDVHYGKAVDCLHALREGCVAQEEAEPFNTGLKDLMNTFHKKNETFWKLVVDGNVLPIHKKEVDHSSYSLDEAKNFFGTSSNVSAEKSSASADAEEDPFSSMD